MSARQLTKDELVFAQRMLPHFLAGKSPTDCARAVLDDDARILSACFDHRASYFLPTADEHGRSYATPEGKGDVIASCLSRQVYDHLAASGAA